MKCMLEGLTKKYDNLIGVMCLVIAALLWGGEFVVAKDVMGVIEPNWINVIRTFFTALIALVIWWKHFKIATVKDWARGALCGILFGIGWALQTMGLELINAGINAFLSCAYIILIPFMVWAVSKKKPEGKVFVSAAIGIVGVTIMSVTGFGTGSLAIGPGEILSLLSAVGYGAAMVALDSCTDKSSVEFLTGSQFIFSFIVSIIFALILEQPPALEASGIMIAEFLYLIVLGTFMTQLLFTYGIKHASATQGGVIFPLESVSATVFGCIFLHEQMLAVQIVGGIMIVAAIIISSVEFKNKENEIIGG